MVAGSGPAWPGTSQTTRPTATPVAVRTAIIQPAEYRPTPSVSGRVCHSTSFKRSATPLTPMNTRLAATPTSSAGRISGSRARAGVAGAAGDGGCAESWGTKPP